MDGRQTRMPIFEAVKDYTLRKTVRFHMPGHKGGRGIAQPVIEFLGEPVFGIDVTGVEGMDDLHQPIGVIREAQELAAMAFGADQTYFLVNGTSCGLHALIMTVCNPGDKIIIPRNVHKSVVAGLVMSGARPVFVMPEINTKLGIATAVTPETLVQTLADHPDTRAVLLTNPTYYGTTTDLVTVNNLVHAAGIPVLLDEAHGPHLHFHPALPEAGMDVGVDACAQGIHKILGGMTQSSMLHIKNGRLNVVRLKAVLRLLQSTSSSYVLMTSLDGARMQIATNGRFLIDRAIELAGECRRRINQLPPLFCPGPADLVGMPGVHGFDPTKVIISAQGLGLTGFQLELILRYEYNIQVELSDFFNVLLIISFGNTREDIDRLVHAFEEIVRRAPDLPLEHSLMRRLKDLGPLPPVPEAPFTPREAFLASSRPRPLAKAVGKVSAEVVTTYPPGIPILCPGEIVTEDIYVYLRAVQETGVRIQGPEDGTLTTLRVIDEL